MKIFLSYSSKDSAAAEAIYFALLGDKHEVFFDRDALPAGGDYRTRINQAIADCELFVFLITPDSVRSDSYALAELETVRRRWPHPRDRVIPVLLLPTPMADLPGYLKPVTILKPVGNAAVAVAAAVAAAGEQLAAQAAATPGPVPPSRRPSATVLALGAAAVLLGVVGLFVALRDGEPAREPTSAGVETASSYPNPLQLRFSYKQAGDGPVPLDKTVRLNLVANRRVFDEERLVEQAGGYYSYNAPYPTDDPMMRGSLTSQVLDSRHAALEVASRFCLTRPKSLQPFKNTYLHLECRPGSPCGVSETSPPWLERCPPEPVKTTRSFGFIATAMAAPGPARRWVVPSARTLQAHPERLKEVGYTLFEISTDAFRDPAVFGVEVGVSVNGEPVDEDGLAPALRPLPNDPRSGFKHRFALQALNFQGMQGGCDAVRLSLRPLRSDGKAAPEHAVTLAYVALRSTAEETLPLGAGQIKWSASYVIPPAEWSHIALFNSFSYRVGDTAGATEKRRLAEDAKRRFDALGLSYEGRPLVAVIRPPLTPSNGSFAYGLAAGVVDASGQVRFSHSAGEAGRLADTLLAERARSREAAALIGRTKYVFNPAGNAERRQRTTPDGLCAHVRPA